MGGKGRVGVHEAAGWESSIRALKALCPPEGSGRGSSTNLHVCPISCAALTNPGCVGILVLRPPSTPVKPDCPCTASGNGSTRAWSSTDTEKCVLLGKAFLSHL